MNNDLQIVMEFSVLAFYLSMLLYHFILWGMRVVHWKKHRAICFFYGGEYFILGLFFLWRGYTYYSFLDILAAAAVAALLPNLGIIFYDYNERNKHK